MIDRIMGVTASRHRGKILGVKLRAARRPLRVFYSYSSKDEVLREELDTHLALLQREGTIEAWHFRKILPGSEWEREIRDELERADIILLLISSDFIASDYCYDREMKRALEKHDEGTARVIPILVRPTDWERTPFARLQALPEDARPVVEWPNRDRAWLSVARGIRSISEGHDDATHHTGARDTAVAAARPVSSAPPSDSEGAEQLVRRAAEAGDSSAANALGLALHDRGKMQEAEKWFRVAATAGSLEGMSNLGYVLSQTGAVSEAKAVLTDALRRDTSRRCTTSGWC
jgi:hypothetical protein